MKASGTRDIDSALKRIINWGSFYLKDIISDPISLEELAKNFCSYEQGMKIKILISILSVEASKLAENYKLYENLFDIASNRVNNELWVVVSAFLVYKRFATLLHKLNRNEGSSMNLSFNKNLLEVSQFMNHQSSQLIGKLTSAVSSEDHDALRYLLPFESSYISSQTPSTASFQSQNINCNANCVWSGSKPDFLNRKRPGASETLPMPSEVKSTANISLSQTEQISSSTLSKKSIGLQQPSSNRPPNMGSSAFVNGTSSLFKSKIPSSIIAASSRASTQPIRALSYNADLGNDDDDGVDEHGKKRLKSGIFEPIKKVIENEKKSQASAKPPSAGKYSGNDREIGVKNPRETSSLLPVQNLTSATAGEVKSEPSKIPSNLSEILSSSSISDGDKIIIDIFFKIYQFVHDPSHGGISISENELNLEKLNSLWPSDLEIKEFTYNTSDGTLYTLFLKRNAWKWKRAKK